MNKKTKFERRKEKNELKADTVNKKTLQFHEIISELRQFSKDNTSRINF